MYLKLDLENHQFVEFSFWTVENMQFELEIIIVFHFVYKTMTFEKKNEKTIYNIWTMQPHIGSSIMVLLGVDVNDVNLFIKFWLIPPPHFFYSIICKIQYYIVKEL